MRPAPGRLKSPRREYDAPMGRTGVPISPIPLDADLPCVQCDYNLRTQSREGDCPECGRSIDDTLRLARLFTRDPRWLRRMARAMVWAMGAMTCFVVLVGTMALQVVSEWLGLDVVLFLNTEMSFVGWVGMVLGVFAFGGLTTRDESASATEQRFCARRTARLGLMIGFGVGLVGISFDLMGMVLPDLLGVLMFGGMAVGSVAMLLYGADIARTIPCRLAAWQAFGVAAGYGLTFGVIAFLLCADYLMPSAARWLTATPYLDGLFVLMWICGIWSIPLLIWYRRRFREAARVAQEQRNVTQG